MWGLHTRTLKLDLQSSHWRKFVFTGMYRNYPDALLLLLGGEYEAMVKSDDQLDEAELTTQFKNFLRSNK